MHHRSTLQVDHQRRHTAADDYLIIADRRRFTHTEWRRFDPQWQRFSVSTKIGSFLYCIGGMIMNQWDSASGDGCCHPLLSNFSTVGEALCLPKNRNPQVHEIHSKMRRQLNMEIHRLYEIHICSPRTSRCRPNCFIIDIMCLAFFL